MRLEPVATPFTSRFVYTSVENGTAEPEQLKGLGSVFCAALGIVFRRFSRRGRLQLVDEQTLFWKLGIWLRSKTV
jgi:hypothetical protein